MGIFHAYDIRGLYEKEITIDTMTQVALLLADEFKPKKAIIGYDIRIGAEKVANAMADALLDSGVEVLFVGLIATPMLYFGVNKHNCDLGIMVTASHNPKEYIGAKITREKAIPIALADGLNKIQARMDETITPAKETKRAKLTEISLLNDYLSFVLPYASNSRNIKAVIDTSNGSTSSIIKEIIENLNIDVKLINQTPDGTFPAHEPNPLNQEATQQFKELTTLEEADIGMMFDGDGDRIGFCDEKGKYIPSDIIGMIISEQILNNNPKATIFYDLRSTRDLPALVEKLGGTAKKTRVGHSFIKKEMREHDGLFASELSGHFYFKDFFYCDDAILAMFWMLNVLSNDPRPLSEIVSEHTHRHKSDEINFTVNDRNKAIALIKENFADAKQDELDGVTAEYDNWWVNVRASNTEPLLRINLEANSQKLLTEKIEQIKELLS